ncbi:hypothetical protein B5M09_011575 [Aphanomyces astaci]|uniref:Reverse transcriptase domain-containing protein n=1 Tax=Aphanomyces astaci TaxID=112090 RepID=A0A425CRU4_APHAT|nr:hypothetical protein B5M09_011575 [Aphanomyces astaci]
MLAHHPSISNKPPGACSSLRPFFLLDSIRKTIPLVTLHRISAKVEAFLDPYQSGFRSSRSTADTVWTHKWLVARANKYQDKHYILGIDPSRAYDTVDRAKLMSVSRPSSRTTLRLSHILLASTTLSLRSEKLNIASPPANTGVPQGASFSPALFVVDLEAALHDLDSSPHEILCHTIPCYDNADFVCSSNNEMDAISGHAPVILAPWSLQMNLNLDKTEHTSAQRKPIDQQTKPPRPPGERARNSAPTSTTLPSSNAATPSLGPASTISGSVTPTSPKPLAFASITAT